MHNQLTGFSVVSVILALLALPCAPARAQSVAVEARNDSASEQYISGDVFGDRAWATPTAFVQPGYSVSVATHLLPMPMVATSVGIAGRGHVTVAALKPSYDDSETLFAFGGKLQLLRTERVTVSAQALVYHVEEEYAASGALTASACVDAGCRNLLTINLAAFDAEHMKLGMLGASLITKVSRHARLVLEADMVRELEPPDHGEFHGYALFGGVRATTGRFAIDLGAGLLIEPNGDTSLPLPMASLAYRFANPS